MRRITTISLIVAYIFYFAAAALAFGGIANLTDEGPFTRIEVFVILAGAFSTFVSGIIIHLLTVIAIDVEHLRDIKDKH